jgi:LysM repeat protein
VGAFAILLATCTVWVQGGGGRTGSAPLTAPGTGRTATVAAHVWVVQPGDTLWGIAQRLEPGADVRPLVDVLSREVHGRPLQVGQRLTLP